MSQPPLPGDPLPFAPPPEARRGPGPGAGAVLGVLVGLLGPVNLAVVAWAPGRLGLSSEVSELIVGLSIVGILGIPVLLLVAGCVLMIPDHLRGWGVAALMASGIWLISSAGVCVVAIVGAVGSYDSSGMMLL